MKEVINALREQYDLVGEINGKYLTHKERRKERKGQ